MKRLLLIGLITVSLMIPCLARQTDADREVARTQEFIQATQQKTAQARINALTAYIKKFPDTTKRWTILAYYQLAINYYHVKNYTNAVKNGETAMKLGVPAGEEARLNLVLAESYGLKDSPLYDKTKALKHAEKAISLAKDDKDVKSAAQKIKKGLTAPPPPKETPEQKIKRLVYQDDDFTGAISFYRGLGAADKGNPAIHESYAYALFKANRLDSALAEYNTLYEKEKKAKTAYRLAEIYSAKAGKAGKYHDNAVNAYIEAGILYEKEGNNSNKDIALKKGKHQLYTKYNYFTKLDRYNAKLKKNQSSASKNQEAILKAKRDLRRHQRYMRNTYPDIDPPQFELDKERNLEKKIAMLESGGTEDMSKERDELKNEEARIEKEFDQSVSQVKTRLK